MATTKEYEMLATALSTAYNETLGATVPGPERGNMLTGIEVTIHAVVNALYADNPRFDHWKFINAIEMDLNPDAFTPGEMIISQGHLGGAFHHG